MYVSALLSNHCLCDYLTRCMYMRNDCNLFRQLRKYYFGVNIDVVCVEVFVLQHSAFSLSHNTNILCRKLLKTTHAKYLMFNLFS